MFLKIIGKRVLWIALIGFFAASCSKNNDVKPDKLDPSKPNPEETQVTYPKKEMRAVWIATVWGLDWPEGNYGEAVQKQKYINYLDKFKELNINAVFFQVKGLGDAYYASSYEPWSASITGTRGKDPGYDVLKFMIEEAHARDIEFHAWMNPYRISTRANGGTAFPVLHSSIDPSWVVNHEKIQIYNPAIPEVRQRLADIVKELLNTYDVDGIHFDDYFYPAASAAGKMVSDQEDYQEYGAAYSTIEDFRRGNVDKTIQAVHEAIVQTKPAVVFSISPAPNQASNYTNLFADVEKWMKEGWFDVVIPQLYQEIGNQYNDFVTNLRWWTRNNHDVPIMVGHGFYKFGDPTMPAAFQSSKELQDQFDISYASDKIVGNAQYSAKYLFMNRVGVTDRLSEIYKNKAVRPFLGREVAAAPTQPSNVKIEGGKLKWSGTNSHNRSIVYYFADKNEKGEVVDIFKGTEIAISKKGFYSVSTINSDNKESEASELVGYK